MSNIFRSSKLEIDLVDTGVALVAAKDYRLARELTQVTGRYAPHVHKPGEEGLYPIGLSLWAKVRHIRALASLGLDVRQKIENWLKMGSQV